MQDFLIKGLIEGRKEHMSMGKKGRVVGCNCRNTVAKMPFHGENDNMVLISD